MMGSDSVSAMLRTAAADQNIKAVVLRVNSPGGSYVASDSIWREVVRTRNAGKPVVVSMSDVAASGGYFIAMAADAIVAQPGTITGSIGVLTAKPVLREAFGKAGISTDSVVLGKHAGMFSTSHPFTSEEWQIVDAWLDHIYADFTGKVAAGRGLTAERVHEIARGRVWTGADAVGLGLVDELGGLEKATAIARRRAGLPATAPLVRYPRLGPLDRIRPASNSEDRRATVGASQGPPLTGLPGLTGLAAMAAIAGLGGQLAGDAAGAAGATGAGGGPGGWAAGRGGRKLGSRMAGSGQLRTSRRRPVAASWPLDLRVMTANFPGDSPAGYEAALGLIASGVTLVTIADDRDDVGVTVSAFCPVSIRPPLILVSLIGDSYPAELLRQA